MRWRMPEKKILERVERLEMLVERVYDDSRDLASTAVWAILYILGVIVAFLCVAVIG